MGGWIVSGEGVGNIRATVKECKYMASEGQCVTEYISDFVDITS